MSANDIVINVEDLEHFAGIPRRDLQNSFSILRQHLDDERPLVRQPRLKRHAAPNLAATEQFSFDISQRFSGIQLNLLHIQINANRRRIPSVLRVIGFIFQQCDEVQPVTRHRHLPTPAGRAEAAAKVIAAEADFLEGDLP